MKEKLGKAISIAVKAHEGQFDRGGNPYILHPLFLMHRLMYDTTLATIAILHDVVEDSDVTIDDLKKDGFSDRVILALQLLTHDPKDTYEKYIEKVATNYDAIMVKRKDLEHNSNIIRLKGVTPHDIQRMEKYHRAYLFLRKAKENY